MRIADVRALVTGAARGLGRCFARELAAAGAAVLCGDVDGAGLRELRREADRFSGSLEIAMADVADEAAVGELVAVADERLGGVNVLINNAGILRDGLAVRLDDDGRPLPLPTAQWRRVLDVNLSGPFHLLREVAARWVADGEAAAGEERGVVVNLSSLARSGNAGQSAYAASKAGLDALTRTWALELAPYGVRVGGVAPGVVDTPIFEGISEAARQRLLAAVPLRRFGRPVEVWQAVRFIIECEFFTGRTVEVDGGAAMGG